MILRELPRLPLWVLTVGALLYLPSLGGGWVWDDVYQYRDNPAITKPWVLMTSDVWGPTGSADPRNTPIYRPLAMVSHVPGQILWRGPLPERLLNLGLHLGVAALVAALAGALGASRRAAWFGAACLAWHPGATEAVAWISSRGDLMGTGLVLGGLLAFARRRDVVAGALFALAPFCKEAFVLAPAALGIWMVGTRRASPTALALSLGGVAAYMGVRLGLGIELPAGGGETTASPLALLGAAGALATRGVELAVWPTAPDALPLFAPAPVTGAVVAALALPLFAGLPGRPWVAALLFSLPLLAVAAPACVANGFTADRYFYVPLAGLGLAMAFGLDALRSRLRWAPVLLALPLLWAPFAAVRALDWTDGGRLFRASLERNPESHEAQFQVAYHLHTVEHDCAAAVPLYAQAMEQSLRAGNNLQACLLDLGRAAEAFRMGPALAAHDPHNPTPAANTARALAKLGDAVQAERWAREAVRRAPDRSRSYVLVGDVLGLEGRHDEALAAYGHALELDPGDATARLGMAVARQRLRAASESRGATAPEASPEAATVR